MHPTLPHRHDQLWDFFIDSVRKALLSNNTARATKLLVNAVREEEDLMQLDGCLVNASHLLAQQFAERQEYTEAEKLYLQVLETREKLLGPGHRDVGDSLKRLTAMESLRELDAIKEKYEALNEWTQLVIEEEAPVSMLDNETSDEEVVEIGPIGINIGFIKTDNAPDKVKKSVSF